MATEKIQTKVKCSTHREKDSVEEFFKHLVNMNLEELKEKFPEMAQFQLMDVQDALNFSKF